MAASACTGGLDPLPTPTPQVVRVAASGPFEDSRAQATNRVVEVAREILGPRGFTIAAPIPDDPADVVFAVTAEPEDDSSGPYVRRYWVPVVAPSHPATDIGSGQLRDVFAGRLFEWSAVAGEPRPLQVIVAANYLFPGGVPIEQWWPEIDTGGAELVSGGVSFRYLPDSLADHTFLSLMPVDAVDSRVKALTVDGINAVSCVGDIAAYPLVERAWVTPRTAGEVSDDLRDALAEAAMAIADRLAAEPPCSN
jgi:hypothetical protein